MSALSITWYGHATFVVGTPGGRHIVFDPWLTGNPKAPAGAKIDKADVICVTHGHSDHTGDVVAVARATGAPVVAVFELANWFQGKGLKDVIGMGVGGTVDVKGLKISMTAERAQEDPHRITAVAIDFTVTGQVSKEQIQRAIDLSHEKYCSVWHSMRQDIGFTTHFTVSA